MNFECLRMWCMNKLINIIVVAAFLFFVIFIIFVAGMCGGFRGFPVSTQVISKNDEKLETKKTSTIYKTLLASTTALSTKKIGWGIKRNDNHEQPDLGATNKRIIEEFDGMAIGNPDEKLIYLTFDVGYEGGHTTKILDVLKENDVKAAFFITGQFLKTNPNIIQRMIDEGHIIGNHTVNHKCLPECSEETIKEEMMNLHKDIFEKFNYEMKYMRPPKGEYSEQCLAYIQNLGYKAVMWSFAYDDWENNKQGREEYGKKKIMNNVHNGEIMLLHATSKDNANILDEVIKNIKSQGYEFKSLDEFVK